MAALVDILDDLTTEVEARILALSLTRYAQEQYRFLARDARAREKQGDIREQVGRARLFEVGAPEPAFQLVWGGSSARGVQYLIPVRIVYPATPKWAAVAADDIEQLAHALRKYDTTVTGCSIRILKEDVAPIWEPLESGWALLTAQILAVLEVT